MSLNYEYLFSQIDKAKKKRWTQADTDKWTKQQKEEKEEPKSREQIGESFTRVPGRKRGKQVGDKKQSESSTRVAGRKRGEGRVTGTGEKTTRNKVPFKGEKRIADIGTEDEGKIRRGTDRKGLKRDYAKEQAKRDAKDAEKKQQEKDLKEGIPKSHSTLDPKSHKRYKMVTDAKGNRVKVLVTERSQEKQDNKKPIGRKQQLRRESGTFNIKDPVEANRRLASADRKFEKERDTISTTSYQEFLRNRKKNPPPSGGFVQDTDNPKDINYDPVSHMEDYHKTVKERAAARAKREADKKERESIDPKTKLPKGPKRIEPPRKDRKKKPNVEEGDPNPEVEGGIDGDDQGEITAREYKETGKALWKAWYKKKVSMSRMKPPKNTKQDKKRKEQQQQMEKKRQLVGTLKKPVKWNVESPKEEESWSDFKERQEASDKKEFARQKPKPKPKPARSTPSDGTSGGFVQDEDDYKNLGKALWKSWLEKKDPTAGIRNDWKFFNTRVSQADEAIEPECRDMVGPLEDKERLTSSGKKSKERWLDEQALAKRPGPAFPKEKSLWKSWLKEKAEEGIGGMNMGAQRGLGHDAGYKQDPGQTAQITEVKDEEKKKGDTERRGFSGSEKQPKHYKYGKHPWDKDGATWHKEESPWKKELNSFIRGYKQGVKEGKGEEHGITVTTNPNYKEHDEKEYAKTTLEENKSAYENHEQDESPENEPNKQQIPPSKPGMDTFKSLYKKALIAKYNNIYKPANI